MQISAARPATRRKPALHLEAVAAIQTGDEGGHRLIRRTRLHLIVHALLLFALAAGVAVRVGYSEWFIGGLGAHNLATN